jgi:aminopeptidase N
MIRALLTRAALTAAALSFLATPALADAPFSFDRAFGRLPKNVRPLAYRIAIAPNAATMTLTGSESIDLDVRSATATIQFNSLNETLRDVTFDGAPVARTVSSNARQLTTITLRSPARPGRHVLAFAYRGKIETGPLGLFAQPYVKPNGGHGLLLSTQLESTDARRVFPCWDEPAFRATFALTATVGKMLASVSNMPIVKRTVHGMLATTTFARTPSMPAYLVEYSAGDIARISETRGGTTFGVWAVKGQEYGGRIALANSEQILADYNDYFGVPYPLPKLDSIAIPGGFQGAMENWGAITYNDQSLLVTPSSTANDRQKVLRRGAPRKKPICVTPTGTGGKIRTATKNPRCAPTRASLRTPSTCTSPTNCKRKTRSTPRSRMPKGKPSCACSRPISHRMSSATASGTTSGRARTQTRRPPTCGSHSERRAVKMSAGSPPIGSTGRAFHSSR